MTLTLNKKKNPAKPRPLKFWQRALRFLGVTLGLTYLGYLSGYGTSQGLGTTLLTMPKALLGTLVVTLITGWVPIGFYYEGHRFRWIYIVAFYLAALIAAYFIGYSVGASA